MRICLQLQRIRLGIIKIQRDLENKKNCVGEFGEDSCKRRLQACGFASFFILYSL